LFILSNAHFAPQLFGILYIIAIIVPIIFVLKHLKTRRYDSGRKIAFIITVYILFLGLKRIFFKRGSCAGRAFSAETRLLPATQFSLIPRMAASIISATAISGPG
jgi:hypothetical protein